MKSEHVLCAGGGRLHDWSIQGRLEGCLGALLFGLLPSLLYSVTNLGLAWDLKHVWSLLLLTSAPALMLTTMKVTSTMPHGFPCCSCLAPVPVRSSHDGHIYKL